nr:hypothetical protein [Tanacetum cinerariifolium]
EDDENNHSNGNVVKRGITRLSKFRREYGKPDGIKLSVTIDALNMISRKHKALFSSFLGDMVREHIGLKILSWKKVDSEARNKLWDEITVKSTANKMARSKFIYQHTMGRGGYALVKEKMKETNDKIKEGTLKVDHGTDAMTVVLGKEKGGYARGVRSGVTYKRYSDLPRSRQASDERILLLQSELDNERRERQEKELLIQNLSNKMSQTEGMVTKLKNQVAAQGGQLQSITDEEGETIVVGCENDASIQKSNGLATLEMEMETRVTMAARGDRNNLVAKRVIDDLIDISQERSPLKTSINLINQLNAVIAELEASGDYEEVFDLVKKLRDDKRDEKDKVADFNRLIAVVEEKIHGKEIDLEMLEAEGNNG